MTREKIKQALESMLFVYGEPLEAKAAADVFGVSSQDMTAILRELANDYDARKSGIRIREMDKSFQLCTDPQNDDYIRLLLTPVKEKKLSQSSLEVLAIIAYRQPVSKTEIDSIRGIKSDKVLEGLIKRGLVEERGRASSIGRPYLYGTTKEFLAAFGFESLSDLPEIEDIEILAADDGEYDEPDPAQMKLDVEPGV